MIAEAIRKEKKLMAEKQYRYEVQGRGAFPWDMLRYDRVWPLSIPEPSSNEDWRQVRTIEVAGYGCTPDRWASFMWTVVDPNRDNFSHGLGCIENPPQMRTE